MKIKSLHIWKLPIYEMDALFKIDPTNKYAPTEIVLDAFSGYAQVFHPTGVIEHINLNNVDGYSYTILDE